ncbi:MAG: hypothetical protein EDM05_57610 [Leptolyngbya sp. IPPAS B-1204]|nr:hypothetical protein [Elainella sp. C42_A2020_010]RNJ65782.1 MAG: hypothetical protein EDM05_29445 [Leptolyngbya sp. IPPAS B-1204]
MSYKDFTLEQINQTFAISIQSNRDVFSAYKQPIQINSAFINQLEYYTTLALAINTEKARSELMIAPILVELKRLTGDRISLFSGIEFNVDVDQGLNGFCDFIISLSSQQLYIEAPVAVIVEAKNENIKGGLGQCLAAMIAAQQFNQQKGNAIDTSYGAVTTGNQWKFLKLENATAEIDSKDYYIDQLTDIMGILLAMVETNASLPTPA